MHLVDAIRLAARKAEGTISRKQPAKAKKGQPEPRSDAKATPPAKPKTKKSKPKPVQEAPVFPEPETQSEAPSSQPIMESVPEESETYFPAEVHPTVSGGGGSAVRLELFLNPEQMHQLLRSILAGAHSVMTLREAAQFLRVKHDALTKLAETGEIPAFLIDGRWKFPRQGVEEWIALQTVTEQDQFSQEEKNAA